MQFPTPYYNILTIPTNKNSGARIVIDGVHGAIIEYNALNQIVGSWAIAAGNDGHGQTFPDGFDSNSGGSGAEEVNMLNGQVLFRVKNLTTTDGAVEDFGGTMNLKSSMVGAGDTNAILVLQSKNESNDGLHPEAVFLQRVQLQDEFGNPGFVVPVDPATPNADESFHNFAFAGSGATLWSYGGSGVHPGYRLLNDKEQMVLTGRFTIPTGGAVAGQAMTQATISAYRPNAVQSVAATVITGTSPNSFVRCFYGVNGVLSLGGPVAALGAGDVIEVLSQHIDLLAT